MTVADTVLSSLALGISGKVGFVGKFEDIAGSPAWDSKPLGRTPEEAALEAVWSEAANAAAVCTAEVAAESLFAEFSFARRTTRDFFLVCYSFSKLSLLNI